jgi:hypothetical protein
MWYSGRTMEACLSSVLAGHIEVDCGARATRVGSTWMTNKWFIRANVN